MSAQDLTIRELQTNLPWTVRYSEDFRATPMSHKDFAHALTHIHKAGGMLAKLVDDMDHRKEVADDPAIRENIKYLADLVVCALRMANTFPGGVVDLQRAVEDRLESKNDVKLPRPKGVDFSQWPEGVAVEVGPAASPELVQRVRTLFEDWTREKP